jgi:hypothetical protein
MAHRKIVKQRWGLITGDDKVDLTDGGETYDELRIVRKVAKIWRNNHFCNAPICNAKAIAYSMSTNHRNYMKSASTIALEAIMLDLTDWFKKQCSPQ